MTSELQHAGTAHGPRPPRPLATVAWLAVAGAVIGLLARMLPLGGIDFQQVWLAAGTPRNAGGYREFYAPSAREATAAAVRRRAADGAMGPRELAATKTNFDIGREAERQAVLPTATPFLYASFAALGAVCGWDYEWGIVLYRLLAVAAGAWAIRTALQHHRLDATETAGVIAAFGVLPECVVSDLRVANVTLVHFALLMLACATMQRGQRLAPLGGGIILGLALAFKPSVFGALPAICLFAVAERRWSFLAALIGGTAAGMAAGWLAGSAWAGSTAAWSEWLANAREMAEPGRMFAARVRDGNFAGMQVCAEVCGTRPRWLAAAVMAAAWLVAVARRFALPSREQDDFAALLPAVACAGVAGGFFISDLAWVHYGVFLLPVIAEPLLRILRSDVGSRGPVGWDGPAPVGVLAGTVAGVGLYGIPLAGLLKLGPLALAVTLNLVWITATVAVIAMMAFADQHIQANDD